jgi:hypothetical protein
LIFRPTSLPLNVDLGLCERRLGEKLREALRLMLGCSAFKISTLGNTRFRDRFFIARSRSMVARMAS